MEALQTLIPLLITLSLAGLVLAVGLNSDREDLLYVLTRPQLLARAIMAVLVIPPVMAGLLIAFAPINVVAKAGIMLMAVSPVPPLVPGKELAIGGRKTYAYGLYAAMALLTVLSVPAVTFLATTLFGRHDYVAIGPIAQTLFIGVLVPLAFGLALRAVAHGFASQVWKWVYRASMLLVVLAFGPIIIKVWPALINLVGDGTLIVMAAITAITLLVGHVLGGPDLRDRATLATAASVRHPGIAMSIAATTFHEPRISAAILLFMLVGLFVAIPYQMWIKRHSPPVAKPTGHAHA